MALAALKAGLAFSNTKTALAHSISYEMTLRFGLPHGIACSFTLPMVLERARSASMPRATRCSRSVFDGDLHGAPRAAGAVPRGASAWRRDFGAYGVSEEDSRRMVASGAGRRARPQFHRRRTDEHAHGLGSTASPAAIDRISIWSGKAVAWLIVPMFVVLFYEVMVRKFVQPDDLGQRHRHDVLRRALLPRRRPTRCTCRSTSAPTSSRATGR